MVYIRMHDGPAHRQKLDRELADVLMAISATTQSIARNLRILSVQMTKEGVNNDK